MQICMVVWSKLIFYCCVLGFDSVAQHYLLFIEDNGDMITKYIESDKKTTKNFSEAIFSLPLRFVKSLIVETGPNVWLIY